MVKCLTEKKNVGQEAIFTCGPDYELIGAEVVICGNDGQWSPDPPVCRCIFARYTCIWISEQCIICGYKLMINYIM